jgi:hypothetical protein
VGIATYGCEVLYSYVDQEESTVRERILDNALYNHVLLLVVKVYEG